MKFETEISSETSGTIFQCTHTSQRTVLSLQSAKLHPHNSKHILIKHFPPKTQLPVINYYYYYYYYLSSLFGIFTITDLKGIMFLGYIVQQQFCSYNLRYM